MNQTKISGHEIQRERLRELVLSQKLPATLMFSGASGVGKRLVALELAQTLLCEENKIFFKGRRGAGHAADLRYGGCGACKSCHVFSSGNAPDFHLLQCLERDQCSVPSLRDLLYQLNLNAFSGGNRVVLFDNAEYLSVQAANLLLKTLEEPRPDTFYLLVSASASRLPATLLSRCQIWFFDILKPADIQEIVKQQISRNPDNPIARLPLEEIALLSDGSLDKLESIAAQYDKWIEIKAAFESLTAPRGAANNGLEFAAQLAKDKDALRIDLQFLRILTRDHMRKACNENDKARFALLLLNLVTAERLILERNLAPLNVLAAAFLNFVSHPEIKTFTRLTNSASLLERISV